MNQDRSAALQSRRAILGAALGAFVGGLTSGSTGCKGSPKSTGSAAPAAPSGPTYSTVLARVAKNIEGLQKQVDKRKSDWLMMAHLGGALLERAELTHRIEDYLAVQRLLDETFAIVPNGTGPLFLAARYSFAVHRVEAADKYLRVMDARAVKKVDEQIAARVLDAQLVAQRGDYPKALEMIEEAHRADPAQGITEKAILLEKTGDGEGADVALEGVAKEANKNDPRGRAWLRLERGVIAMNHGKYEAALERLTEADNEMSGWWLVQERIAEDHAMLDDYPKALSVLEPLVRDTGLPQHMDALASCYQHMNQADKATEFIEKAAKLWEEQLKKLPEAAMGHGLEHQLQFGTADAALDLAKKNYAIRPGPEANVALARAHLKAKQPQDALDAALKALATQYRTAGLHDVTAQAYSALGSPDKAAEQLDLCVKLNPRYRGQPHAH